MRRNLKAQTSLKQPLKLIISNVHLPMTSRKAVPQPWASNHKTSVAKAAA